MPIERRIVFTVAAGIIALMMRFPPWRTNYGRADYPVGYHFIASPPMERREQESFRLPPLPGIGGSAPNIKNSVMMPMKATIDVTRLLIQCLCVSLLTAVVLMFVRDKKTHAD